MISNEGPPSGICGGANNFNTDTILVNNVSPGQALASLFYLYLDNFVRPYGPGFTNEPGASDEIELTMNFGAGGRLGLASSAILDPAKPLNLTLGGSQVNLNADEVEGIDPDITMNGVTGLYISGSSGIDRVVGSGGGGTPAIPVTTRMEAHGALGVTAPGDNDTFIGGSGADSLHGEGGADFLSGGAGKDFISGSAGEDTVFGGRGKDALHGGSDADRIFGNKQNDELTGGPARDLLHGGAGRKDGCSRGAKRRRCELKIPDFATDFPF